MKFTLIIALRFVYVKYFLYVYSLIMPVQAAKLYHAVCFMRQSYEGRWSRAPRSEPGQRDHRILQKTLVFSAARLRRAQAEGLKIRYDAKAFSA